MILELAVILLGLSVGGRGPALEDWKAKRQAKRDAVKARVVYLPSAVCRPDTLAGWCRAPGCAVCLAKSSLLARDLHPL